MKSFLLALLIGILGALVTGQLFRNAFERKIERKIEAIVEGSISPEDRAALATSTFRPPTNYFRGPTGQPFIIGPSGPPPNR